eukprot:CAMPEP_0117698282 /NCGR_PEP_ID=MMETSP0804-20121206/29679_1 /TAXON_ID=1074897 /ORGANISM="Tetraselmis astigmatica, Strain CCMP880" /LENGTH=547 /DNA_ID=CAMNT_0005512589 /DNA_START=466 /DNA_END=2109 /DNA_ORIENTATION=-
MRVPSALLVGTAGSGVLVTGAPGLIALSSRAITTLEAPRDEQGKNPVTEDWPYALVTQPPQKAVKDPKTPEGEAQPLSLRDAMVAYKSRTAGDLLRAVAVFQSCKFPWLVKNAEGLLNTASQVSKSLTDSVVKKTFFAHFCAGENEDEVKPVMQKLGSSHVGSILDYAAEADLDTEEDPSSGRPVYLQKTEDHCDGNLKKYLNAISLATNATEGGGVVAVKIKTEDHCDGNLKKYLNAISLATNATEGGGVVAVKITSLGNPALLQRMSFLSSEDLIEEEHKLVQTVKERVHALGQAAQASHVRMLIDAEQSYFQPAIDALTMDLMKSYNTRDTVVFNTYQCYLKGSHEKLQSHLEEAQTQGWKLGAKLVRGAYIKSERERADAQGSHEKLQSHLEEAQTQGWKLGAKLVRGAYMKSERERADALGHPSPVHETIEDTHYSFDRSVETMLHAVKAGNGEVVIASHNEQSVLTAMSLMEELGLDNHNAGVMFGQLQGMCDFLTYSLSAKGYHSYKYLPYGPLHEVMPYLLRRAQENSAEIHRPRRRGE